MGISPDDTFTYWLPGDLSKPEGERRGLVYRHGTAGDWRRFTADKEKGKDLPRDEYFDGLLALAKRGLTGWVGFSRPFDGAIEELPVTEDTIRELVDDLRMSSLLSEMEKKRLSRLAPSPTANSAKGASASVAS